METLIIIVAAGILICVILLIFEYGFFQKRDNSLFRIPFQSRDRVVEILRFADQTKIGEWKLNPFPFLSTIIKDPYFEQIGIKSVTLG